MRFRLISRPALKRLAVLAIVLAIALMYGYISMIRMPGWSHTGPLPALSPAQAALADELRASVSVLADATGGVGRVGNRSMFYPKRFADAASWIHDQLKSFGFTDINESFVERGARVPNLEVVVPGASEPSRIVVVGAHYDAFQGTPGADDNASGVAACLHLARIFRARPQSCTLRFVFFVNEEPPTFWTEDMGSYLYAKKCHAASDDISAMISLESIGYYSDAPGSQRYPEPLNRLYSDRAAFIAFVSNYTSRSLNKRAIEVFRRTTPFPSEGGSPPGIFPGVGWSDQWSFWQFGYSALMVTDTATFRNPNYHTPLDKPDTLDYSRMARVVEGLERVIEDLAARR